LETDNILILSYDCWIRLLVTSMNLIHSWGVYSIGWKLDGIPGITNGIYNHIYIIGFYNGLCYELCGLLHNFMSIRMKTVNLLFLSSSFYYVTKFISQLIIFLLLVIRLELIKDKRLLVVDIKYYWFLI